MFYNTGIATYIWVLTNKKAEHRQDKVQLTDASKWFRPLRKSLGKKNCELGPDDIERICQTFLDFEETAQSKIFDNEGFGYWKVTVERPLRLAVNLSEERLARFVHVCREASDAALGDAVHDVANEMGPGPHRNFGAFAIAMKGELKQQRGKATLTAKRKRLVREGLADRDEEADPVVKKAYPRTAVPDSIRGRFAREEGRGSRVVEYEPDTQLRDTEQILPLERGGIEGFLRREVLPYAPDAWYVPKSVKVGYEISFNRHFYRPEPMRTVEEIRADILAVERETDGLFGGLLARQAVPVPARLRVYIDTSVIGGCEDHAFRGHPAG